MRRKIVSIVMASAIDKGLVILSCELIDNNGKELKKCCNNYAKDWNLEAEFIDCVEERPGSYPPRNSCCCFQS